MKRSFTKLSTQLTNDQRIGKIMANTEVLNEFIEKVKLHESEKEELKEYEKELYAEYKDRLDVKAFRYALRIAKIKQKLSQTEDAEVDQQVEVLLEKF